MNLRAWVCSNSAILYLCLPTALWTITWSPTRNTPPAPVRLTSQNRSSRVSAVQYLATGITAQVWGQSI